MDNKPKASKQVPNRVSIWMVDETDSSNEFIYVGNGIYRDLIVGTIARLSLAPELKKFSKYITDYFNAERNSKGVVTRLIIPFKSDIHEIITSNPRLLEKALDWEPTFN